MLFFWRGREPAPPRTLDCVPVQSEEIDIQQTMLATVAGVLELMNNFLCRKLEPFRFFCGLIYDFNQGEKKDIEMHYLEILSSERFNKSIRKAVSESNPLPLIKRIWQLKGLTEEYAFLKTHKAFETSFHSEQKKALEKAKAIIDKEYQDLSNQKKEILTNIFDSLGKGELAFEAPEEMRCSITNMIMLRPVCYSPSPEREGEAQENKGEGQERKGEAQENKGEGQEREGKPQENKGEYRYRYEKRSIEATFKRQKDLGKELRHPHTRKLVKETDFVEDGILKDKIEIFISVKIWKAYKQEQASLARSAVPGR